MLRFFRTLRRKLIEEDNMRKYFWYALGEVLLVVFGILIALQINNWNENRKLEHISDDTIINLKSELEEAKSILEFSIGENKRIISQVDYYLYSESSFDSLRKVESIVFDLPNYVPVALDLMITNQETSSERLIIGQNELSELLNDINSQVRGLEKQLLYADEFWNNTVSSYFIDAKAIAAFDTRYQGAISAEEAVEKILYDDEYITIVALSKMLTSAYLFFEEALLESIEKALQEIENLD